MPKSDKLLHPTTPILAGVIGSPTAHSLSPLIHTIWAYRADINGYYIPIQVSPSYEDFEKSMDSLRSIGFSGVNVTIPHKENALRYAKDASDTAQKAGAANMLSFTHDGAYADNSDVVGFANAVKGKLGEFRKLSSALILGAGGAARGICLAFQSLGINDISISNRTKEKAQTLADEFSLTLVDWRTRSEALADKDILVNTTSLGMSGQPALEIDLAALADNAVVSDIVYAPLETPLLKAARGAGFFTIDGLDMLMHQAAPGFKAWLAPEIKTPVAVVDQPLRDELIAELDRRADKKNRKCND